MIKSEQFHISAVIGAATGILCDDINDIKRLLSFMVGESVFTHSLPRVGRECKPYLYDQFPWLTGLDMDKARQENGHDKEAWLSWVDTVGQKWVNGSDNVVVQSIPQDDHDVINPVEELKSLGFNSDQIIEINLNEPDEPSTTGEINWKVD